MVLSKQRNTLSVRPDSNSSANVTNAVPVLPKAKTSTSASAVPNVKGLWTILRVKLLSVEGSETTMALCDTVCNHSCVTLKVADKLNVRGHTIKITFNQSNQISRDSQRWNSRLGNVHFSWRTQRSLSINASREVNYQRWARLHQCICPSTRVSTSCALELWSIQLRWCWVSTCYGRFCSHPFLRELRNGFEELTDSHSYYVGMGFGRASSFDHLCEFDVPKLMWEPETWLS